MQLRVSSIWRIVAYEFGRSDPIQQQLQCGPETVTGPFYLSHSAVDTMKTFVGPGNAACCSLLSFFGIIFLVSTTVSISKCGNNLLISEK